MDFAEFRLRILVQAAPAQLYRAWMTSRELERWFLTKADYLTADGEPALKDHVAGSSDQYRWEWIEGTVEKGEILAANAPNSISLTFGSGITVDVALSVVNGRTLVQLTQTDTITDIERRQQRYVDCYGGWTFYLANLKSVYEGGADLREKEPIPGALVNV